MIKCEIEKDKPIHVEVKGTTLDVTMEATAIIYRVYNLINQQSPAAAEVFKRTFMKVMLDPRSPVWNKEE